MDGTTDGIMISLFSSSLSELNLNDDRTGVLTWEGISSSSLSYGSAVVYADGSEGSEAVA